MESLDELLRERFAALVWSPVFLIAPAKCQYDEKMR